MDFGQFGCNATQANAGLIGNVPLPIPGKINALAALHCQRGYAVHLIPIRDAAVRLLRSRLPAGYDRASMAHARPHLSSSGCTRTAKICNGSWLGRTLQGAPPPRLDGSL
jgi:hypothetical protein